MPKHRESHFDEVSARASPLQHGTKKHEQEHE
ncbi:Uncharacterised protein [Vibrio cholerae]|nr:Uncharacterised protein [Vibrio cholerae]